MNKEKGFTLLEVVLMSAIGGLLLTGVVSGILQVVIGTSRSNSQVVADTDINNAALVIRKDLMMTQSSTLTPSDPVPQSEVTFFWTDYTGFESSEPVDHSSHYILEGTGELLRTYDDSPTAEIVGRHITYLDFRLDAVDDSIIHVTITATGPGTQQQSKTLEFSAAIRATGVEEE